MTYEEALAFWFGRINYEVRVPHPGDLKLDRMRALLRLLGDPHDRLRIIHVAGSKGKGSTSAMLASILRQAGYRTGLFTSPHLSQVEERIQVDGAPISAEELAELMGEIKTAVDGSLSAAGRSLASRGTLPTADGQLPTYFEIATALGFLHFARRQVDVAVVEVGLGGRFDSTNVCRPLVSLITSISLDHTQQLGNTLGRIAMEKAGVVKPETPVVSGVSAGEPRRVIEEICQKRRAPLSQLGKDFHYAYDPGQVPASNPFEIGAESLRMPRVRITTPRETWTVMELGLLGEHQAANAAVAISCVEQLRDAGLHVSGAAVASGLAQVSWPARLEIFPHCPLVVLDCAHNVASAEALVATLLVSFPPSRRLLIFAGSNDKDLTGMLRILAPHFAHAFLTRYRQSPRSEPPLHLAQRLREIAALPHTVCPTAQAAWKAAVEMARPDDLICITGSVFLAGELRPVFLHGLADASTPSLTAG